MADNYYTTQEAARLLGISVRSVQQWLDKGLLEGWKTAGGHRRITYASVRRALESGRTPPPAAPFAVLVVEDDPTMRKLYRGQLARWPFVTTIHTAPNGYEGLVMIGEAKPDLLVCDLRLPGVSGFQIVRALCGIERYAAMEIVVVSALAAEEIAAHGGLPDRVRIFAKPIDFPRLRTMAETMWRRQGRAAPPPHPGRRASP